MTVPAHFDDAGLAPHATSATDRFVTPDTVASAPAWRARLSRLDSVALFYVAIPNVLFLCGWIVAPWGWLAAVTVSVCVLWTAVKTNDGEAAALGRRWWLIVAVATAWCVVGGIGHFVYANIDWFVRDAVVVDLVRNPWPVRYHVDGQDLLLRSAIGYYLPPALIGKLTSVRVADLALLAWTIVGVAITFALLLRDRPSWSACLIRLFVFVMFSGMDIIPTVVRNYPTEPGAFIEWWARYISFQSQTTSLIWAPNHTMSVWIATAWLATQSFKTISLERAALFVILTPLSSPIAALGILVFVTCLAIYRLVAGPIVTVARQLLHPRVVVVAAACLVLVYPYLLSGSGEIHSGFFWDLKWVGEDFVPRYIEFVLVEFLCVSVVLLVYKPRDPLLWIATAELLALPIYRFGPFDDLAMRGSIPGLEVLAIRLGMWMSTWPERSRSSDPRWGLRLTAFVLFAIGAVTPFMEIARPFVKPGWPMDTEKSIVEASPASHYLTFDRGRWLQDFLKPAAPPH